MAEVIRQRLGVTALNGAHTSADQKVFGGTSLELDGTNDYLLCGDGTETPFHFGANDFTIEGWIRPTAINTSGSPMEPLWNKYKTSNNQRMLSFGIYDGKLGYFWAGAGSSGNVVQTTQTISTNTWQHIALCRESNTWNTYYNGTRVDTRTISNTLHSSTEPIYIGSYFGTSGNEIQGYIDELRVSKVARYTGTSFTVPTTPFSNDDDTLQLLHMDGTDGGTFFQDDNGEGRTAVGMQAVGNSHTSTDQSKFGNTSIEFDGTGDYLNIPATAGGVDNPVMGLTGDYTLECWARFDNVSSGTHGLIGSEDTSPYHSLQQGSGTISWQTPYLTQSGISTGTWYHIAVTRSGSTVRLFVNGSLSGSGTNSDEIFPGPTDNYNVFIGRDAFSGYLDGYLSEVRISSSARYTSAFTAPTAPFVNDSDTLLLLHGTGTNNSTVFQDDNGVTRAEVEVQSINGAAIDTANYQWSGASAEFDDTNDYLELPFRHGNFSGDFTIECWMDTADTLGEFMACQKQGTAEGWTFITRSLGRLVWTSTTDGSTASALLSSNSAWSDNTWVHIAVCHNNSTGLTEMFANGARVASRTEQNPKTVTSGGYFRIGGNIYGVSSGVYQDGPRYFGGHLDDVRISNSVRYSGASYTVPTGPFQNDSNTVLLLPMNGTDASTDFVDDNGKEKN